MKPLENMLKLDESMFEVGSTYKGCVNYRGVAIYYICGIGVRSSATGTPLRIMPLMSPMIYCI